MDDVLVYVGLGVGLVAVGSVFLLVTAAVPPLLVLAPLLALPVSGVMRAAVASARDDVPTVRMAIGELGRLAGRKVAIAAVQLLLTVLALSNLVLAREIGGILGILSALVSGYALLVVGVLALSVWPVVCDPAREGPLGAQLRLGLAAAFLRPIALLALLVIGVLAAIVCAQLLAPSLFLPPIVVLAVRRRRVSDSASTGASAGRSDSPIGPLEA